MAPYIITIIVAILIFIPAFVKAYSLSKLSRLAEKELRILTLQISLSDTLAEYHFWEAEAFNFLKFYKGKINPRFFIVCVSLLNNALSQRYGRGFTKETKQ